MVRVKRTETERQGDLRPRFSRRFRLRRAAEARLDVIPVADMRQGAQVYCGLAARLAAGHYEVPLSDIAAGTRRSRRVARARHLAMYLAHVAYGLPLRVVGARFGRDRTTAAYACRIIEDARDDPAFDAALAGLELSAGILLPRGRAEGAV